MSAKNLSVSTQPTRELPRPEPLVTRVKHIMTVDVVSVSPTASVGRAARLMHERAISGIPVVDIDRAWNTHNAPDGRRPLNSKLPECVGNHRLGEF